MPDLRKCPSFNGHAMHVRGEGKQSVDDLQVDVDAGTPGGWPDPSTWEHSMQTSGMSEG